MKKLCAFDVDSRTGAQYSPCSLNTFELASPAAQTSAVSAQLVHASLPILDWVIARHAGQIVIGEDGNTSEMCQELKSVLEGMGFYVAILEESDASKRCKRCKFRGKARNYRACKQCGLLWQSEIARASTILAKFRGNEQGSRLYPHTIRTHEAADWPLW